jgi:hypothetical protein
MPNKLGPSQRGAATLLVCIVLLFAMTLIAVFANRNLIFETRSASNLVRATQAFEAAEAGIEWAIAMLNSRRPIDAACLRSERAEDRSFRERRLRYDALDTMQWPLTWNDAGKPTALLASCIRGTDGWTCSCPASGLPSLPAGAARPSFSVQLAAGPQPGLVRLTSTGCASSGAICPAESGSRIQVLLGLVPGLGTAPTAPLTAKDGIAMAGSIGVHNPDAAANGITVHAGGSIAMPAARLTTVPGGPLAGSSIERDAALAASGADAFFAAFFGLDRNAWRDLPAVARTRCESNCAAALAALIADGRNPLVWVDGDLELEGPASLGSRERPVMLVASGAVRIKGGVTLHGLVYGTRVSWDAGVGAGQVHGAVVSQGSVDGSGTPDLAYDGVVLDALKNNSGSLAKVPGSWKDF